MRVKIDQDARSAYITLLRRPLKKGEVDYTLSSEDINLDFDKRGRLLGIEILYLKQLHPDVLRKKPVKHDKDCYCQRCLGS